MALISDKTRMAIPGRSEGDGMENHFQYNSESARKMCEVTQKPADINFVPSPLKRKGPKFVPYEPYKAAVLPIIPNLSKKDRSTLAKVMSNHHLIRPLAEKVVAECSFHTLPVLKQLDEFSHSSPIQKSSDLFSSPVKHVCCEEEKEALNKKIQQLSKEKKDLESQLKIQTQVNSELKKLLVASLGEDLQLRVQYLSEDKAKLGEDILFYSEKLFENNEELDNLSVQCDVWKSKYQASSLMIDELAGWKVVLSRTFTEAAKALENILQEHNDIFQQLAMTHRILSDVQGAFEPGSRQKLSCSPTSVDILHLAGSIRTLSAGLQNRLLGTTSSSKQQVICEIPLLTAAEQLAKNVIGSIDSLPTLTKLEASKRNECGLGAKACQLLPHTCHNETILNCCRHCEGEVKLV